MKPTSIFISYNPNSELEETLAYRLHTIGAVNGFTMYLPNRYNFENQLSEESKSRISRSDYFVVFSTIGLSNVVKEEIECAFEYLQDKSKILVIYDKANGKNLSGDITNYFVPFYFDKYNNRQDELLNVIMNTISHKEQNVIINNQSKEIQRLKEEKTNSNALAAILGVGLGLFVLSALSDKK
jgi:hypothetical protein